MEGGVERQGEKKGGRGELTDKERKKEEELEGGVERQGKKKGGRGS